MIQTNLGVIILRTLTKKSRISFGPLENLSVQDVLNVGYSRYLKWIYYNISHVTFDATILKELEIESIIKPGINKKKYQELSRFKRH